MQQPDYAPLLPKPSPRTPGQPLDEIVDHVLVRFGRQILEVVPGRVSTEVDARLSFDTAASVARARRIVALYEAAGIARERVLIKIASTWGRHPGGAHPRARGHPLQPDPAVRLLPGGGLRRGRRVADLALRRPHLRLVQEGRRRRLGRGRQRRRQRPGVKSVAQIYTYHKKFGIDTEVMGASFRNVGQILALAGCDLLTISPELLAQLQAASRRCRARSTRPRRVKASIHAVTTTTRPASAGRSTRTRWPPRSWPRHPRLRGRRGQSWTDDRSAVADGRAALRSDRAWTALAGHYEAHGRGSTCARPSRATRAASPPVGRGAGGSPTCRRTVDLATLKFLVDLARECRLEERRDAMFAGAPINSTEGRAVLHTALRARAAGAVQRRGARRARRHARLRRRARHAASGIRRRQHRHRRQRPGAADGGAGARRLRAPGRRFHFVANVDGHDITPVLRHLKPAETLFIVASKTFTTQETMANAGPRAPGSSRTAAARRHRKHFVATTTNVKAAAEFGISTTFGFWDWVGGRYSLWSAIGLPIAPSPSAPRTSAPCWPARTRWTAISPAPLAKNLPALLGLLDVWYRNFHGFTSRSVAPLSPGPPRLPAYLQQLEMESNGKRVDLTASRCPTAPARWCGASPAPTASMPTSRCCTRHRT